MQLTWKVARANALRHCNRVGCCLASCGEAVPQKGSGNRVSTISQIFRPLTCERCADRSANQDEGRSGARELDATGQGILVSALPAFTKVVCGQHLSVYGQSTHAIRAAAQNCP